MFHSTDLLFALEDLPSPNTPFSSNLPPARSVGKLWPQSEGSIAMPQGHTMVVNRPYHALLIVLALSQTDALNKVWQQEAYLRLQRQVIRFKTSLEGVDKWESTIEQLLRLPRSWPLLTSLLHDAAGVDNTNTPKMLDQRGTSQKLLARSLIDSLRNEGEKSRDMLMPALRPYTTTEVWSTLEEDLKIAITTWYTRFGSGDQPSEHIVALRTGLEQDCAMTDSDLSTSFQELSICQAHPLRPRRKRRKLAMEDPNARRTALFRETALLLTGIESEDLSSMPELAPSIYDELLSDEDKCAAWRCLTELASLDFAITQATVSRLLETPSLRYTPGPRVLSAIAVKALVQRTEDAAYTMLRTSQFGKHCMAGISSSLRELRIASSHLLPCFLRDDLPEHTKSQNRQVALQLLRELSDRDVASEQETLIAAWGQVAVSCSDTELNLVLLRLVDYLGHSNPIVVGYAFSEIEAIAIAKGKRPVDMFQPFWRSVAVSVVQDLSVKPQKTQQLCDILGMGVNTFLVHTQRETLPTLVLTKKKDIVQRIAGARTNGSTAKDVCMQPRSNLASILTLLLVQPWADPEDTALACLTEIAPEFQNTDMAGLVKLDPVLVACEMLKYCGEEHESRKPVAYQALQLVASISERMPGQRRKSSRKELEAFLESHLLGILTHFSTMLEIGLSAEPTSERIRCINGMIEMFSLSKGHVSVALPQIRACLQSALEQDDTREVAFDAWLALIAVLDEEDVATIVDETFVIITRHWSAISPALHQKAHAMLGQLVKGHNTILQDNIMTLPSLNGVPLLSKFAAEFERLRSSESVESQCRSFARRLRVDGDMLVFQTLTELVLFLETNQDFIHDTAGSEHPSVVVSELVCALLDVTVRNTAPDAAELCGRALGIIGCLDPNRVEAIRKKRHLLVLSNFESADDVIEWIVSLFEDVLVKAFKSVTNARQQGFLAYTMQELLKFCGFGDATNLRPRGSQAPDSLKRWNTLPDHVRATLTPLLTSRYLVTSNSELSVPNRKYPSFDVEHSHSHWLRSITTDLLFKAKGDNAQAFFPLLARILRGQDLAIPRFIFPYAVLNVVLGGTVSEIKGITDEFLAVLQADPQSNSQQETVRLCSENVFAVLDYTSTWLREKRKKLSETRAAAYKTGVTPNEFDEDKAIGQIETTEDFLASIPAKIVAQQAVECRSFSRALFYWDQHIRQKRSVIPDKTLTTSDEELYTTLQNIYSQIDEPDGLEGMAAHLPFVSELQTAINHSKAGRWTAAQAWFELQLADEPDNALLQHNVLECFRETGQYAPLLRYANGFLDLNRDDTEKASGQSQILLPLAAEACWMTGTLRALEPRLQLDTKIVNPDFNVGVGRLLLHASNQKESSFELELHALRKSITDGLSLAGTDSLQACHNEMFKLHVLYELETLMSATADQVPQLLRTLDKRLNVVGSYVQDKQYLLGVRRAVMALRGEEVFSRSRYGGLWLTTARLARQAKNTSCAHNAVLNASDCGDYGAKLEEARLLWHEGHQRQAIQSLEAALDNNIFDAADTDLEYTQSHNLVPSCEPINGHAQNVLTGKALLLLAKWLDASGQSQTKDMTDRYQLAARRHQRWEKGHYYLGKHYSKLLDAQKALRVDKRTQSFMSGELTKLVIDNSLRSIPFGNKYWHETIPRILTLWLELGTDAMNRGAREDPAITEKRSKSLAACNKQLQKYFERVPPYVFYHALPQLISRITHPHPDVWKQLCNILTRIATAHPSQALWSLFSVVKATDRVRVERGNEILNRLKDSKNKSKSETTALDLRTLINQGQRLSDGLLQACEQPVEARAVRVSLKGLGFNMKLAPSNLVVPVEATLTASAPSSATSESIRKHKAFTQDKITIQSFLDDVLVLNSLQRPKKITLRGSDGKQYGLLCKPKDDLRKDQRLMEFNGIINRALKRNTESSKRRLYIKTYAVTPLSEESGTIEWVEGIKPMRDILLNIYARKGIQPNYNEIKKDLDVACSSPNNAHVFEEKVLHQFPASMHEWFTETYPEPDIWFNARLRYARTAAVMSMTGHILGLGDRHGENILLEEGTGGVFHVDFNCLFDKGLTFEKPELVPFRLTHNMVDAMGAYGYEGPFRKSSELTLGLLRQEKDTLMTVLETFLYDPTTDFVGNKKKRNTAGVPETPAEILESVATKLKGLLRGETVPLSTEGYVDALIQEATSHFRLASMYIGESYLPVIQCVDADISLAGWCSFL